MGQVNQESGYCMPTEISFDYAPELARRVARRFFFASTQWLLLVVSAVGLFGLITVLAGERGWLQGASLTLLAIYLFQWYRYEGAAAQVAQEMSDRAVTVRFDDNGLTFQTSDHLSTVNWSRFKRVVRLPEAWLFFIYTDHNYTMIPSQSLDPALRAFIERKLKEHGGQVI
jgi:uncharacterized membrane protein